MSSHDCQLRASLTLKETVIQSDIEAAIRPFLEWDGRSFQHHVVNDGIRYCAADKELKILLDVSMNYSGDEAVRSFVKNLHSLVAEPGYLEVYDFDTGDTESAIVPHFIGATRKDRARAQVEYGILQAEEWLTPILGTDAMQQLAQTIRSLPILKTAQPN